MTELPPDKARDFAGFTRLQVVAIRREAWSGLHDDGHRYYFDGDRFWRLAGSAPISRSPRRRCPSMAGSMPMTAAATSAGGLLHSRVSRAEKASGRERVSLHARKSLPPSASPGPCAWRRRAASTSTTASASGVRYPVRMTCTDTTRRRGVGRRSRE